LEEEFIGFDGDFLEEAVVDPAVGWAIDFTEVGWEDLVDGEEGCVVVGDLEFVQVSM
jgi:hypothetical protein